MKPLMLKMYNIGPFLDETLDFSKLSNMFLVTGATGAGKTFIFDSIMFALYGSVPGTRDTVKDSVISNFAKAEDDSFVDFSFAMRKAIYHIHRSARYPAESFLELVLDEKPQVLATKTKDINNYVIKLLGLKSGEFSKVVLLPQGQFSTFLHQKTSERGETLKALFPVRIFEIQMEEAKNRAKALENQFNALCEEVKKCEARPSYPYSDEKFLAKKAELEALDATMAKLSSDKDAITARIENGKIMTENAKKLAANKARLATLEKESAQIAILEKKLDRAQKALRLKSLLDADRVAKNAFIDANGNYIRAKAQLEKAKRILETLKEKEKSIDTLRDTLKTDEALVGKLRTKLDDIRQFLIEGARALHEKERLNGSLQGTAAGEGTYTEGELEGSITAQQRGLGDGLGAGAYTEGEIDTFNITLREAAERLSKAKKRDELLARLKQLEKSLALQLSKKEKLDESLAAQKKALDDAKAAYESFTQKNLAHTLSRVLKNGCPCPVCGSLEHPAPAKASEDTSALEKSISDLEKALDTLQRDCSLIAQEVAATNAKIEELKATLAEYDGTIATEDAQKLYFQALNIAQSLKALCEKKEQAVKAATFDIATFDKEKESATHDATRLGATVESLAATAKTAKSTMEKSEADFSKALSSSDFQSSEEVQNALMAEIAVKAAQEKISGHRESIQALKALIEEDKSIGDPVKMEQKLRALEGDLEKVKRETKEKTLLRDEKLKALNDYEREWGEYNEKKAAKKASFEELVPAKKLADTLNGKNPAAIKIDDWALGEAFAEIVTVATREFQNLSRGRYTFCTGGEGAKVNKREKLHGLNLYVLDNYTNTVRDVNSLSGGETFQASISLALATSEVVLQHSGQVNLDCLFIDEGFGTLDSELLDAAMEELNELGETRMVGVISHIEDLKRYIPSRVEVTKTATGSRLKLFDW